MCAISDVQLAAMVKHPRLDGTLGEQRLCKHKESYKIFFFKKKITFPIKETKLEIRIKL